MILDRGSNSILSKVHCHEVRFPTSIVINNCNSSASVSYSFNDSVDGFQAIPVSEYLKRADTEKLKEVFCKVSLQSMVEFVVFYRELNVSCLFHLCSMQPSKKMEKSISGLKILFRSFSVFSLIVRATMIP